MYVDSQTFMDAVIDIGALIHACDFQPKMIRLENRDYCQVCAKKAKISMMEPAMGCSLQ